MRLHSDVSIKVVQGAISLLAAVPSTLVHTFNLFVPTTGTFVLLSARDGDERVDL